MLAAVLLLYHQACTHSSAFTPWAFKDVGAAATATYGKRQVLVDSSVLHLLPEDTQDGLNSSRRVGHNPPDVGFGDPELQL